MADVPRKKFPKHLVEIYDIDTLVGQGAFSTVWRCVHRASGQVRAVKKIDTTELSPREIAHEIALMRLLRHHCVVRCYDVFLEAQYVNIVVDMFNGGDLVDGLNAHRKARGRIPDGQLAHLARQMVSAVAHVHGLQIIHRDIKGENFLSDRPDIGDPCCRVALADFGTAMRIEPNEKLSCKVGTPAFWAPEIWAGSYDFLVDVWAVGVTTYILLTGALPFDGEAQICQPVAVGEPPVVVPYSTSRECADFLAACMEKNPQQRPLATEALQHTWMLTAPEEPGTSPSRRGPDVEQPASLLLGAIIDGIQSVIMGCCSGLGHCLDLILRGSSSEPPKPRQAEAVAATAAPEKAEIEKQVTELTKRISTNVARLELHV